MFRELAINIGASIIYDFGKVINNVAAKKETIQVVLKKLGASSSLHDFPERYVEALVEQRFSGKNQVVMNFFSEESIMKLFYDYYYDDSVIQNNEAVLWRGIAHSVEALKVGDDITAQGIDVIAEVEQFWEIFKQKVNESRTVKEIEVQKLIREVKSSTVSIEEGISSIIEKLGSDKMVQTGNTTMPLNDFLNQNAEKIWNITNVGTININTESKPNYLSPEYLKYVEQIKHNKQIGTTELLYNIDFNKIDDDTLSEFYSKERVKQDILNGNGELTNIRSFTNLEILELAENEFFKKGAFLSLGKKINSVVNSASPSKFVIYKGSNRSIPIINKEAKGNLVQQFKELNRFFEDAFPLLRDVNTNKEEREIPLIVFRELISNALIHREYSSNTHSNIQVEIYDDRIEIKSPGHPQDGIDLNRPVEVSVMKNPEIAAIFYLFAFVERLGSGIVRAQEELRIAEMKPASFENLSNPNCVKVVVFKKKIDTRTIVSNTTDFDAASFEKQIITYESDKGVRHIPRLLTPSPFISDFFIGRDADLASIDAVFQNKKLLVLVNGEGGMGKTTLAAHYWQQHAARYAHLAWIFAESGVDNALVSLANVLGVQFQPTDSIKTQVARVTQAIMHLNAPILLVLDNVNNADDLETHLMVLKSLTNCHVLLTSRAMVSGEAMIQRILPLNHDFARQVFKKHYPKHADTEGSLLDALLYAVGYNTLVIEVMAKNLAVFNKFQTTYGLASLVADLQTKGLLAVQNRAVKVIYQADTLRTELPENIIAAMYDLSELSETERYLLSNFAVLPAENISFETMTELLKPADAADLEGPLSTLQQKGWLDYFEGSNSFKMSPVIQAVTQLKNKEWLLVDCDTLIWTLMDVLAPDNFYHDFKKSTIFASYAETAVEAIDEPNFNAVILCQRVGTFSETIGNLDKAMYFYKKCSQLSKKLYELFPQNVNFKHGLAISYSKLGETHMALGNLDKALNFYEDYNHLEKELYSDHSDNVAFKNGLAISYEKLGQTHAALGNLDKVLGFYEKGIELNKELYADYPRMMAFKNGLAISYSKLGETHAVMGNLEVALGFYEKDIELRKELYAAYPMDVSYKNGLAVSYEQLGNTHKALGNLHNALEFYEDYFKLRKELYADFPTNVAFKNGLAISYEKLGDTQTALQNFDKALPFYNDEVRLFKELYAAYPTNVDFKNGLAVSYYKLGAFNKYYFQDITKAKTYFEQAESLWIELVIAAPMYVQFQRFLGIVQKDLSALD